MVFLFLTFYDNWIRADFELFFILGNQTECFCQLLTNQELDYEKDSTLVLLVKVADHANLSHIAEFNISVIDRNDKPTNLTILGETMVFVMENRVDTEIGKLEVVDEDDGQSYT